MNDRLTSFTHSRRWFSPWSAISWALWIALPLYIGMAIWQVLLPAPVTIYQPPTPTSAFDLSRTLQASGWFAKTLPDKAPAPEPTAVTLNTQYKLQGVFLRNRLPSVVILTDGAFSEVMIEGKPSKMGLTVDQVRASEVEVIDGGGKRFVVKMHPASHLEKLYTTSTAVASGDDLFVPNTDLNLRPINPGRPKPATITPIQNASALPATSLHADPTASPRDSNTRSPVIGNIALGSLPTVGNPGETLSPAMESMLARNLRYGQLDAENRVQIRNLLSAPHLAEALRNDPTILDQLVESFPINATAVSPEK